MFLYFLAGLIYGIVLGVSGMLIFAYVSINREKKKEEKKEEECKPYDMYEDK